MDHATTMRRLYDLINAGDIDGFARQFRYESPTLGKSQQWTRKVIETRRAGQRPVVRRGASGPRGRRATV